MVVVGRGRGRGGDPNITTTVTLLCHRERERDRVIRRLAVVDLCERGGGGAIERAASERVRERETERDREREFGFSLCGLMSKERPLADFMGRTIESHSAVE